jgi:methylated-DNA-[protein]-cysteine S-methyltransferase
MEPVERLAFCRTPIGLLEIAEEDGAITRVEFVAGAASERGGRTPVLDACRTQLEEYFAGRRRSFALELKPAGTAFQRAVWSELLRIPYGRTSTYARVAASIDRGRAVRAVGAANGRNPISIIIPCHRVLGSDGSLVGYGGGLWRKEWLLGHESGGRLPFA